MLAVAAQGHALFVSTNAPHGGCRDRCHHQGMSTNTNTTSPAGEILSRDEAAVFLRVSPATLQNWAAHGTGPRYSRSGDVRGRTWYRRADLLLWLESRTVTTGMERR